MSLHREVIVYLNQWKKKSNRKPLIVRGARQVGKTTLIREFAKVYKHTIILNLELEADLRYFLQFDDVNTIVEALFLTNNIPTADIGETLLFIDEIQESPKAIQFLRYFYEDVANLHVISAGSLLEFAIRDVKSFPVGRVEYLYLYPLNFKEYLHATGRTALLDQLQRIPLAPAAHPALMEAFHRYAIIGGMPEIVKTDIAHNNLADLPAVYESIWGTYKDDVEKYTKNDTERRVIKHLMNIGPLYLDERVKFQGFGNSNYRSREVGEAFRTLEQAKIISLVYPTTDTTPPLKEDIKKSPRLQFLDTGIVNYTLGVQGDMLAVDDLNKSYKGALIPHLIVQEMISLQHTVVRPPLFWVREKAQSSAEVDILYPYKDIAIPIEIKSGATGSLKSLHLYVEAVGHPFAIRMYAGELKLEKTTTPGKKPYLLLNLPYYLGAYLPDYVAWLVQQKL
ncbi:ATP-binding protein [Sphingobacterium olei]|uniref:ATP-binding protein n=1 Tax=Sphingobacterium olei TaxID=2571155 RepID=A0A4U0PG84_9SPHI|nr:AAA family ATPase [Sphingobacterium olei]TJZ61774.1 ATP-binding protein [Sphingobacterium olei]